MKNPDSLAGGPGRVKNQLHRHSTRALTADPQNAHHGPLESRCEAASTFLTERDIRAEHRALARLTLAHSGRSRRVRRQRHLPFFA